MQKIYLVDYNCGFEGKFKKLFEIFLQTFSWFFMACVPTIHIQGTSKENY